MTLVIYTNSVSPHQLPLARAIAEKITGRVYYIYTNKRSEERKNLGWPEEASDWIIHQASEAERCRGLLTNADVLISGVRNIELFKTRWQNGRFTIYASERWFKPWQGILRLLKPSYFRMAYKFARLLGMREKMLYFPMGIHAARDMARLCGLMHGDLKCLFKAPKLDFENKPGGAIWLKGQPWNIQSAQKYCLDKMRMWGYFVEPSKYDALPVQESAKTKPREIRVLWVGRLLNLKRVDVIVRAVSAHANLKRVDVSLPKITLDIYGTGPEEKRLKKMAAKHGDFIRFHPPVPISEVRRLMREHDVYVIASNGYEGWGAVVSEALEEGVRVLGTYEAGSSATILPESCLFHAGEWRRLVKLLQSEIQDVGIGTWSAKEAAKCLYVMFSTIH